MNGRYFAFTDYSSPFTFPSGKELTQQSGLGVTSYGIVGGLRLAAVRKPSGSLLPFSLCILL